tara:strand:- start:152 stop:640 length:489 start_codon:yes stop_codon:yes gene_type:complete
MEYTFYKLSIANKCYVGSTTNLHRRMSRHKTRCNNEKDKNYHLKVYQYIRENGCWNDVEITIIETNKCDKGEALDLETTLMLRDDAELNSRYPKRSLKDYYETNKQSILEKNKEYREKNREKIKEKNKEKITCDICSKIINKRHIARHRKIHSFTGENIHPS